MFEQLLSRFAGARICALAILISTTAVAANEVQTTAATQRDLPAIQSQRTAVRAQAAGAQAAVRASRVATSGSGAPPAEYFANVFRAYPASCVNSPMPLGAYTSDSHRFQATVNLIGDPYNGSAAEANYTEPVTITLWRVVCSNGFDSSNNIVYQSAVLLEFDRSASEGSTPYPTTPGISVAQNGNALNVRYADDPNTFFSAVYPVTPLFNSDVYVLENFFDSQTTQFNYNQAFTLTIDNFNLDDSNRITTWSVPAYNHANYADSALALPISGYMTSNWFDPNHGGEGILTQIFDNNDGATRTFTAAWYTFDQNGLPFWLYTQGTINIGDRTTGNVDTYYPTGGCFAGVGCSSAGFTKWGTVNFSFPDCAHMVFTFNGSPSANAPKGPTGNGTRSWLRIANVNSIVCD
ncbi:MAG TPA: hypothetical protein VGH81_03585 [Rudaea sp.]